MFVLRTGLQGNGKTLNTIKEVDLKAAGEEREVFYHNIRGFNPNAEVLKAVWTEFDDPHKWYELPTNAIIVIDEAQTFFRTRKQTDAVPEYASALETMRHHGHELHCITQNPSLIDHHFRKLCNSHIHYVRGHKGRIIKRWQFERCNMDVERKNTFEDGEHSRIMLDKNYFGVYQSVTDGATHHMRFHPPKALYVLLVGIVLMLFLGYRLYNNRINPADALPKSDNAVSDEERLASIAKATEKVTMPAHPQLELLNQSRAQLPMSLEQYQYMHTPRIADQPYSAPIYDQIRTVKSYPRLGCVRSNNPDFIYAKSKDRRWKIGRRDGQVQACTCYTQQRTVARVSFDACMNHFEGLIDFDPARADREDGDYGLYGGMKTVKVDPKNPKFMDDYLVNQEVKRLQRRSTQTK